MRFVFALLLLSGCTASFQPWPPAVSREEINAALKQRDENILAVAQQLADLAKTTAHVSTKGDPK